MLGTDISPVEVSGISKHGFWILLDGEEELFVPFMEFPWFRKSPVEHLFNVERPHPHHLYWPDLDVDLHVESIRPPERFPLLAVSSEAARGLALLDKLDRMEAGAEDP
jgi:hypothetical protein